MWPASLNQKVLFIIYITSKLIYQNDQDELNCTILGYEYFQLESMDVFNFFAQIY